tara:strand:+ start:1880 stop:2299 length:420 start_codon:yes stop_codon:yes gene_type:complete
MMWEEVLKKKKDACYHKVRARYKVWPSAYASGALVQCRKVGAKNWGKSKKVKKCSACKGHEYDNVSKDWVSCSSCTDDKKGTEPCGRKDASKGTKRRCRPTCSACKDYKRRGGKPKKRRAGTFSKEKDKGLHGWFERRG